MQMLTSTGDDAFEHVALTEKMMIGHSFLLPCSFSLSLFCCPCISALGIIWGAQCFNLVPRS